MNIFMIKIFPAVFCRDHEASHSNFDLSYIQYYYAKKLNLSAPPLPCRYLLCVAGWIFMAILLTNKCYSHENEARLDKLKIGNVEYTDVRVTLENRYRARIIHSSGIARVATIQLPENLQKQLGLIKDPPPKVVSTIVASKLTHVELQPWFDKVVEKNGWNIESTISVSQTTDMGKLVYIDLSNDLVMLTGDSAERADGDWFKAIVAETGEFYEYKTVLGANKKVKIFSVQKPIQLIGLKKKLKSGVTYKVTIRNQPALCNTCKGRPVTCEDCDETGIITHDVTVQIRWK